MTIIAFFTTRNRPKRTAEALDELTGPDRRAMSLDTDPEFFDNVQILRMAQDAGVEGDLKSLKIFSDLIRANARWLNEVNSRKVKP